MSKLVSIVLPTYNGQRYIKEAIQSIINQTYKNWELIIVNDCSIDSTLEIVSEFVSNDNRIRVISNSVNQHVAKTLNNGFREARGEYFTWISDDNKFKPDAIEYMVNFLNKNKSVDFITCAYEVIDENGKLTGFSYDYFSKKRNICELLYENNIGACFMYRKELACKILPYDSTFPLANDYDYWMRAAAEGNFIYDNRVLYEYRMHPNNLTNLKRDDMIQETAEIIKKNALSLVSGLKVSKKQKINTLIDLYDELNNKLYLDIANKIDSNETKKANFKNKLIKRTIGLKRYIKHIVIYFFGIKIKLKRKKS